jgi:hypothetical protein
MAVLSFGVNGPFQNWQVSMSINDSDSPRILAWLSSAQSGYGTVTENVQYEEPDMSWSPAEDQTEEDRPTILMQKWITRTASSEEAAKNFAESTLKTLLNNTVQWERQKAAQEAADSIPPIEI